MSMTEEREIKIEVVAGQIKEKLRNLDPEKLRNLDMKKPSDPCIFRLHDRLRKVNEDAYEPVTMAIGPYHRNNPRLKPMEDYKLGVLKLLLSERFLLSLDQYVMEMKQLEERARKCYVDPIKIEPEDFVKMMLLDSCFIIQFFRTWKHQWKKQDPMLTKAILRDLILLENQLPFFVLVKFQEMSKLDEEEDIIDMAYEALQQIPGQYKKPPSQKEIALEGIDHLLDLLHAAWCSRLPTSQTQSGPVYLTGEDKWKHIKPTTQLENAGVTFKCEKERDLFNVWFENGVMELSPIDIDHETEAIARNLIAYEQYLPPNRRRFLTDYFKLLDGLVNGPKDVEILRHHGIIDHGMGSDSEVAVMINKLGNHVNVSSDFSHAEIFNKVNKHCERQMNVWKANLINTYCNTPWKMISLFAAVVLLVLTVAQTVFSILSYVAPKA